LHKAIKVIQDIKDDGSLNDAEKYIVEEFKTYKTISLSNSLDNFTTPNEESTQREETSVHPLFGRDRIFDFPERVLTLIWKENLAHVHIDSDGEWDIPTFQWFTTSKNSLIYSAFKYEDTYVFVVLDILKDYDKEDTKGAHNYYKESDVVNFIELAEWHRTVYPHEDQKLV